MPIRAEGVYLQCDEYEKVIEAEIASAFGIPPGLLKSREPITAAQFMAEETEQRWKDHFFLNFSFRFMEAHIDKICRYLRLERRRWVSGEPWWMPWFIGGVACAMLGFIKAACG